MAGTGPHGCAGTQHWSGIRRGCAAEQILHTEPQNHAGLGAGGPNTVSAQDPEGQQQERARNQTFLREDLCLTAAIVTAGKRNRAGPWV